MAGWDEFQAAAPAVAAAGRQLIFRGPAGEALLATVRGTDPPRIHPVNVEIVGGELYVFVLPSAKLADLERDGRYALHAHVDPAAPSEFMLRGRAHEVLDAEVRASVAAAWSFTADETFRLFRLDIEAALLGERSDADDWPPRYARWTEV